MGQGKGKGDGNKAGGFAGLEGSLGEKLVASEQLWGELENQTEVLGRVLEDKEKKIKDAKD